MGCDRMRWDVMGCDRMIWDVLCCADVMSIPLEESWASIQNT